MDIVGVLGHTEQPSSEKTTLHTKKSRIIAVVIGLILLCSVVAVSVVFLTKRGNAEQIITNLADGSVNEINVNEEKITSDEIENKFNSLPEESKQKTTKQELTEAVVSEKLLLQEATKEDIRVSSQEVDDYISLAMRLSGMTNEDYQQRLAQFGISEEQYREEVEKQIMAAKLINQSIKPESYQVSEAEIDSYLEKNKDNYEGLLDDEKNVAAIRIRVKRSLEIEKKNELLKGYLETLREKAVIN